MNPGIFISYSREDEKQAMHLLALLRREGYSVWIDQEAIAGASIWSDEIVQNIKSSEIFIALLSASSASSPNVAKEIALAAEHGKIILPIEIGAVELPGRLEYALAGIQKTNFQDEEAILRAVRSQVAKLEGAESPTGAKESSRSRSLRRRRNVLMGLLAMALIAAGMILLLRRTPEAATPDNAVVVLPFATLNLDQDSTHNLDIFSDGLLTRLSAINTLTTVGASVSSPYKDSRLNALAIAKELHARFIVEGLVRKSHDVNFISTRVFDVKRGGEIWEEYYSGNERELFPMRERISSELCGFLHGVTANEIDLRAAEANLAAHPIDASACARVANMLIGSDKTRALALFERAIKLDSSNLSYYLSAGIAADRNNDPGRAKDYGKLSIVLFKQRMALYPDSENLTANLAIALVLAGLDAQAEALYDSLLPLYLKDIRLNFNAACCLAKADKADAALDILEKLFVFAPGRKAEVESDPDFDNIRTSPRYQMLMYGPLR
jgi:TolB-like protein